MNRSDPTDDFLAALALASGRDAAPDRVLSAELRALARRLVAHGRIIAADAPCPTAWIRRAEALFAPRAGRRVVAALWTLLFDSRASLSPAIRGTRRSRFLRIGGEGGSIDAELTGLGTDHVRLVGALDAALRDARVVFEPSRGAAIRSPVGDGGTFEVDVPSSTTSFTLAIRAGRRLVARSPRIDVASG